MVVIRGCRLITGCDPLSDFKIFVSLFEESITRHYTDFEFIDKLGAHLFIRRNTNQETIYYDYIWTDTENELFWVILEINFLINDPKVQYFIIAVGDLRQEYKNGILDAYVETDSVNHTLSILRRCSQGEHMINTYNLVKDTKSGKARLEEI